MKVPLSVGHPAAGGLAGFAVGALGRVLQLPQRVARGVQVRDATTGPQISDVRRRLSTDEARCPKVFPKRVTGTMNHGRFVRELTRRHEVADLASRSALATREILCHQTVTVPI